MTSPPTWKVGWFDHPRTGCYISCYQGEEYWYDSNKVDICYPCSHCPGQTLVICLSYTNKHDRFSTLRIPYSITYIVFLISNWKNPTTRIWFRLKDGLYSIIHVCLSISYQPCFKIKLVSLWVHLNIRPNCVISENLSWPYVFQYATTNHEYICIVVLRNSTKPYFIWPVN